MSEDSNLVTDPLQKDKIIQTLSSFWELLTEEEAVLLYEKLSYRFFKKGELIYTEKETPQDLICVISGQIKIFRTGVSQRKQIMRIVNQGEFLGYRAFFAGEDYITSASAIDETLVAFIPLEDIHQILSVNSRMALYFIRLLSIDLGISDRRIITLTQNHIRGRLAETLLFLKHTYGLEEDGATIAISLTRDNLASYANMTTANAIRTLSSFSEEGLIQIDHRKITILNEKRLRRISELG